MDWGLIERAAEDPDAVDDLCQSRAQTVEMCMALLEMRDALLTVKGESCLLKMWEAANDALDCCDVGDDDG